MKRVTFFIVTLFLFFQNLFSFSLQKEYYNLEILKKAQEQNLYKDPYWLKLLYIKKNIFNNYKSQNKNPNFFISKYGNINPEVELKASLKGFLYEGDDNSSPECKFPQRYFWLREKLNIDSNIFPFRNCSNFNSWKETLNLKSIYLVFSSGYMNNPSTLYGHTFLLLKSKTNTKNSLLDYTLNYAATTSDENGPLFAIKGLFGLYPGNFTTMPYYLKIQEYQNMENRDLWEYPLNFSDKELDVFLRHTWELGKASFPYYFFNKNCSWQILPLLEIVKPDLKLTDKFHFWVIPTDTLKVIVKQLSIGESSYRPSIFNKTKNKINQLNDDEKKQVYLITKSTNNLNLVEGYSNEEKVKIYETAVDLLSFKHFSHSLGQKEMDLLMDPILNKRSEIPIYEDLFSPPLKPLSPVLGHESFKLAPSIISDLKGRTFYQIEIRSSFQDLLENNEGYIKNSMLEMGDLKLRYLEKENKFFIQEAKMVNIISLNPMDLWQRKLSWEFYLGYKRYERDKSYQADGIFSLNFSLGPSFKIKENFIFYVLPQFDFSYGTILNDNFRLGLGPKSGFYITEGKIKSLVEIKYMSFFLGKIKPYLKEEISFSYELNKNNSLRLSFVKYPEYKEINFSYNLFLFPI